MVNILPAGFYKFKSDLCSNLKLEKDLNSKDKLLLDTIHNLTEKDVFDILEAIAITSSSGLIVRDIDMFKMRYGMGYDKIYVHKVIAGKHDLSYKLSFYSVTKVLKTFKRHLIANNLNKDNG